jgi:hypothetical protein
MRTETCSGREKNSEYLIDHITNYVCCVARNLTFPSAYDTQQDAHCEEKIDFATSRVKNMKHGARNVKDNQIQNVTVFYIFLTCIV